MIRSSSRLATVASASTISLTMARSFGLRFALLWGTPSTIQ
jgi:hypothetical protein